MTEKQAWERFSELKRSIALSTAPVQDETLAQQQQRVAKLLTNPEAFCKYYFPQFFDPQNGGAPLGWFHKRAFKEAVANPNIFAVLEWPREHAKSVLADIFLPLFLKAKGEVSGLVICSHTRNKASGLLSDLQAQLESNRRYIADFGLQYNFGSWSEGHFVTQDGTGFWAIGKGESPRGLREAEKRPNLLVIDDFDEDEEAQNEIRVAKSLKWLRGALIGAMAIKQRRILMVGNRIHKRAVLAHIVGDVEEGDLVNKGICHIKAFALENPKTHQEDQSEKGMPAWKERYERLDLERVFEQMGYLMSQREFFHHHIEIGHHFKEEWIRYEPVGSLKDFDIVITYNDPSFKDSKKNDYKAIVAVGKRAKRWYLLDCWVRQATRAAMAKAHYDMAERLASRNPSRALHYIEANFMQDQLIEDYIHESAERNYMLAIKADMRSKPNKQGRIENVAVYFERGLVSIAENLRGERDWQNLKDQFMAFPAGHDDGPDAFEGAMHKVNEHVRIEAPMTLGGLRRTNRM